MAEKKTLHDRLAALNPEQRARLLARVKADKAAAAPLPVADRSGPLPLSFAQRRLWFLERLEGRSAAYNMPAAFRLRGALDVPAAVDALHEIVSRHEVLRTRLVEIDGEPAQVIDASPRPDLVRTADGEDDDLRALLDAEARHVFDLAAEHPIRALLVRIGADEHVLAITLHHVAGDGWSTGILFREFAAIYNSITDGRPSPLPPLAVQYADFSAWQQERLADPAFTTPQVEYWRRTLAGAPGVVDLPTDGPRGTGVGSHDGGAAFFRIDGLAPQVADLARGCDASPYMVLLAAYIALLHRWSGDTDITVGSPIANRPRPELEGLIGFFVNTLALRVTLDGDPDFAELVRRVRATAVDAYAHAELPFEQIVEKLNPERRLDRSPFFQQMFALQSASDAVVELRGLSVDALPVTTGAARLDMTMSLQEEGEGYAGCLEYATPLFRHATAQRFAESYRTLLAAALRQPGTPVSRIDCLSHGERHRLLVEWNRTDVPSSGNRCLHQMVEAQAARTPQAIALRDGATAWTYAELMARSARVAAWLRQRGVAADTLVGVCMERGPDMIAALLGVLRAGGAYVALDPAYPEARTEFVLKDSGAGIVLRDGCVDSMPEVATFEPAAVRPSDLAYVLYTSGSTGTPKGVAIEHRSPVALLEWAQTVWTPEELAGVLAGTSICFDLSVFEIFLPLSVGGTVILADTVLDLPGLEARNRVTLVNTVPSAIDALLHQRAIPTSVRVVNLAGEPLPTELVDRLYDVATVEKVYDLYGPSEDTTYSTFALRRRGEPPTIGRPIANTRLYILDKAMQPVPPGLPGEIYLAGQGLARGYLGRPDLTAERFVPSPFPGVDRLYRTGDRARFRDDGNVEFLGRFDHQVKLRGFRIELGEIEAGLRAFPEVSQCVVIVDEGRAGQRRLVGYVAHPGGQSLAPAIQAHLRTRLPEYMVPPAIVVLDALPLTPNGKIDRKALPSPDKETAGAQDERPLNATETRLAAIWAALLGTEGIAATDDFFARGGHSLLAARLVARIRDEFGVELPLRAVFEFPTLRAQADAIVAGFPGRRSAEREGDSRPDHPIPILPDRTRLPLSFAQERLWFLDQLEPGNTAYVMGGALRLRGHLDVSALAAAFDRVVERHEALRVVFRAEDGRPYATLGPRPTLRAVASITDEQTRPFDLAEGPLLRASLARNGDEAVLAIAMHHIISDGWSIDRLLEELCAGYGSTKGDTLPPLPVQYADFAAWQRERARSGALDGQLAYWRDVLRGAPTRLELPTDRPRPDAQSYRAATHRAIIDAPLAQLLAERGRALQVTPFMTLLAAFGAALHAWSGADDIVIGFPAAGRSRTELEPLIGMFVNTVPVRLQLEDGATFAQVAAHARTRTLEALANQDVPFEKLVDELRVERSLAWSPLFQVMLVMQEAKRPPAAPRGLSVEPLPAPPVTTTKFDLTLAIADHGGTMGITFEYDRALFDAATIERFSNDFLALLRRTLETPAEPLVDEVGRPKPAPMTASAPTSGPAPFEAPAGPVERALAGIWREVLRLDRVSATGNYFELGGDSILSIQVIARLRERGWRLTPKDIFRNQTLRALAAVATPAGIGAAPTEGVGTAPLTVSPIQRLFLGLAGDARHHFNQALLLDIDPAIEPDDLEAALREVQRVHPALRGRFAREHGQWREQASPDVDVTIERFDCDTLALEAECQRLQRSLNIERGPVFRAAHFRIAQQARLFLVAHHLVVDAVSWRIILDDVTRALGQLAAGHAPSLPDEHASARAVRTAQLARHEPATGERRPVLGALMLDGGPSRPTMIERTSPCTSTVAAERLLSAFGRALCAVAQRPQVVVDVERHGRDEGDLDLSRSVGWFTRIVPTRIAADDGLAIPLASASDGLSDVSFNFLGQGLAGGTEGVIRGLAPESAGDSAAPGMPRRYRLDVNAALSDGVLRLQLSFDAGVLPVHQVEEIAARTLASLDETPQPEVEAAYPLTPSQLGMWLQSAAQPGTPAFVEQAAFVMEGGVDAVALNTALAQVISRHATLRSAIVADGDGALRVVFRSVETSVREVEPQAGESEDAALTRIMDEDRRAGYRLDRPPLLRFVLLRVTPTRAWLVMSFHHVILDGWSLALFWAEAAACYEAARAGRSPALPSPPDERPLEEWLRTQAGDEAEAYWRERLAGITTATPAVAPLPPSQYGKPAEHEHIMSLGAGRAIAALSRESRVPPALVFEVLWSLLLAGRARTDDVVFAATVSGRPPSVPGIERMLGCFINTVPVRVTVDRDASLGSLLGQHHQDRVSQAEFEQCSAGQVHAWSQVPAGQPLAQTLLVYENLPGSEVQGSTATGAPARRVQGAWTAYPLALLISPGATPHLRVVYQPDAIDAGAVADLAREFDQLALAASAGTPVAALVSSVTPVMPAALKASTLTVERPSYVAPRTLLEHQLAGIWEQLFAAGAIGVLDDFFSLGGHSLLAVQLAAQVRTQLKRELPLQTLLAHPTIERLARAMEAGTPHAGSLVTLAEGGDEPAVVCPHPLGGHVLCYGPLARQLAGRTMWGLQAPGLAEDERPAASWDDLIDHHWRSLASVTTRPFALLGYSYGGYLAIELAARAIAAGSAPGPVILLDVPHPSVIPPGTRHPDAATLLHAMFGRDLGIELEAMRAVSERELVQLVYDAALARHVLPDGTPIGQVERLLAVAAAHSRLAPPERRYEFPIVLLRAREGATRIAAIDDYGWGPWCAGVQVEWVDGSHETMLETVHVAGIARFLRKYVTGTAVSLARS